VPGIPQNILDDILDRSDIVEIISNHIALKKAGRNFKALCPFHHEKTPSFMVSPDKQIYHCFACNKGGNAFRFLMEYDKMEFLDAVKMLAKKTGVTLPSVKRTSPEETSLTEKIARANELAAHFYTNNLLKSDPGKPPAEYLKKRNITKGSIAKFRLGFSLNSWSGLIEYARKNGIGTDILSKAGLVLKSNKDNSFYDRFRNRFIFPVFDVKGRIIAFGGRVLDDTLPKYVNSPETPLYTKGRQLYGLNFAKPSIAKADYVIIVEGYMDLISPYQAGIENIVASSGTAFTSEQARLLKRFTSNAVMVFDADSAGEAATLRNLDVLLSEGFSVRVVSLPTGYDPDTFVNKFGPAEFTKTLEEAKDLFIYKLGLLSKKYKASSPQGKAKISAEMLATIWRIPNEVLKSSYMRRLGRELDIDEGALWAEFKKIKGDYSYQKEAPLDKTDKCALLATAEKILLSLMLEDASIIGKIKDELDCDTFQDGGVRRVVKALYDFHEESKDVTPNKLINYLEDDMTSQLISELVTDVSRYQDKDKNISDCIRWIKENAHKCRLKDLQSQIHSAQNSGDHSRIKELVLEYSTILKQNRS